MGLLARNCLKDYKLHVFSKDCSIKAYVLLE